MTYLYHVVILSTDSLRNIINTKCKILLNYRGRIFYEII